jgi:O-antigen ligase
MIRISLLLLVVAFFSFYAWRNWFVSVCAAILLMAVVQHPDFPNSIFGIHGLNPWNILLFCVLLAWWRRRKEEGLVWDLPERAYWLFLGFLVVVVVGVARLMIHPPQGDSFGNIISEDLVNCVKWMIPGVLLFDACRTRRRVVTALVIVLLLYFLLALQVIRWMPLGYAISEEDFAGRASKIIDRSIGYDRTNMSMLLAGACWATLSTLILVRKNLYRLAIIGAAGAVALAQALTGGRTGYATWILVGMALAMVRWRKLLPVIPIAIICAGIALPGVRDRMLQGFGGKQGAFEVETSDYRILSGRNVAWPRVIALIEKAPLLGYGREGMVTTGLKDKLWYDFHESFPHPHQAYLQQLLDNGIIGFFLVLPLYFFVLRRSFHLVLDRSDPLVCAVGCAAFSAVLGLMISGFGGQTFYPREGSVGMWAAIGIMLRVYVQRARFLQFGTPLFDDEAIAPDDEVNWSPSEAEPAPTPVYSRLAR